MKSVKLSLATIVAAGALTSIASATPLEQAIKDVDVSGFAWIQYQNNRGKTETETVAKDGVTYNEGEETYENDGFWKFKTQINLKFAIDDNFYALLGVRYENKDQSYNSDYAGMTNFGKGAHDNGHKDYHDDTLDINQYALGYHIGNTDILVGRQFVGSFLTADMAGTGLKVVNKDITGLTLTAAAFDALEDDTDIGSSDALGQVINNDYNSDTGRYSAGKYLFQQNLYTVQVNGSYSPVEFALWYANLANVANLYGADVAAFFDINDNFGLGVHGELAGSSVTNKLKDGVENAAANVDADRLGVRKVWLDNENGIPTKTYAANEAASTLFWALAANMKLFGLDANAGFIQYGKKDGISLVALEDSGKLIKPGEVLLDYTAFAGKHQYWFLTAKYNFLEKYSVGADFISGETKYDDFKTKEWETVARAEYKYSKKLSFFAWWSHVSEKDKDTYDERKRTNDRFRFRATYKF